MIVSSQQYYLSPKIVYPEPIWKFWLALLLLIMVVLLALVLAFDYGRDQVNLEKNQLIIAQHKQRQKIESLTAENQQWQYKYRLLARSYDIDKQSWQQLQQQFYQLQQQYQALQQKLAFYQEIELPDINQKKLVIQNVKILPMPQKNQYQYQFILLQAKAKATLITGEWSLQLLDKAKTRLSFAEITATKQEKQVYQLKYFQYLTGIIQLPSDFVPQILKISLWKAAMKKDKKPQQTDYDYYWSKILMQANNTKTLP